MLAPIEPDAPAPGSFAALSLDIPEPAHWLEARLMAPIVERLFGTDYPRLEYLVALKKRALPANVRVTEFYFQSGAALGNPVMQRHYVSSNYTHVARDLIDRGVNLMFQLVARDDKGRLSLSCNPDVTLDLVRRAKNRSGYRLYSVAHVHPDLPYMQGDAEVPDDYFDQVIDSGPERLCDVSRVGRARHMGHQHHRSQFGVIGGKVPDHLRHRKVFGKHNLQNSPSCPLSPLKRLKLFGLTASLNT